MSSRVTTPYGLTAILDTDGTWSFTFPAGKAKAGRALVRPFPRLVARTVALDVAACGIPDRRIPALRAMARVLGPGATIHLNPRETPGFVPDRIY